MADLLGSSNATLAPLYDVNSALPYTRLHGSRYDNVRKLHSAFQLGCSDAFTRVEVQDWEIVAHQLTLDPERAIARVRDILAQTPGAVEAAEHEVLEGAELGHSSTTNWTEILAEYHAKLQIKVSTDAEN